MAIDPRIPYVTGDFGGVAGRLAALDKRLRQAELGAGMQAPGSIQGTHVGADQIATVHIAANSITAAEIAAGSIYAGAIQAGAITASSIAANAVTANAIAANVITAAHIAANTITAAQIAANTITAAQIAAATITATQIAAGTITASNIASGTITAAQISAGTITATQIAADTITASNIAADAITATELAANAVYASAIQANAVTANAIAANSIYTNAIQANAVTAAQISVSTLSALSTHMGSLDAGTITGGTVQTASSGSRVVMDSAGLRGYALNGTTKVFEINAGSGIASFTGVANIDAASVIPGGTVTVGTLPGDRIVSASIATLQLAAGAITANTIAAGAVTAQKLSVTWGGNNTLYNSRFTDGVNKWGLYQHVGGNTLSSDNSVGRSSPSSAKVVAGGSGSSQLGIVYSAATADRPRAAPGEVWTASGYMRSDTANQIGYMLMSWYDSSGNYLSATQGPSVSLPTAAGQWARAATTETAPAGTVYAGAYFVAQRQDGAAITGITYWYTDAQVEPGEVAMGFAPRPDEILPGSVGATQITPNSITTNEILAGTILGSDIAGTTITGTNIAAGTIAASHISVSTLSAITVDMGTLTAGTITGAVVRTSENTTRVQMDSTGVYALQSGVTTFKLNASSGVITQGRRATASNEVVYGGFVGPSVTIQVDADVSLVHIFVEAEIYGTLGTYDVYVDEATDLGTIKVLSTGNTTYTYTRTVPGSTSGTSQKLAGYISYRPTGTGARTFQLYSEAVTDEANQTDARIRNRMIHVYTT